MDRIVITVNDRVAKNWRNTTPELRSKIEKGLEKQISDLLEQTQQINFETALKSLRSKAAANGLTQEILEQLLNEKE